jgi:hypothetical protein
MNIQMAVAGPTPAVRWIAGCGLPRPRAGRSGPPPRADLGVVRRHPELLECRPARKPIWYALDAAVLLAMALIVVVSGGFRLPSKGPRDC